MPLRLHIPGAKRSLKRWLKNPHAWEFAGVLAPLLGTGASAVGHYLTGQKRWAIWATGAALGQTALAGGKFWASVAESASREDLHELEGCLQTLHAILIGTRPKKTEPRLRLTMHVPISDGKELCQVLNYVGNGRVPKTAGRRFSAQCGIIGRAFREKEVLAAQRKKRDYEGYVEELVKVWHYAEPDARRLDPATMSWLALPLVNEHSNEVEGILYADSTDRGFFTQRRIELATYASVGIGIFVKKRYGTH